MERKAMKTSLIGYQQEPEVDLPALFPAKKNTCTVRGKNRLLDRIWPLWVRALMIDDDSTLYPFDSTFPRRSTCCSSITLH